MAKDNYYVSCPFYKKDEPVKIRCEGLEDDNRIILQFYTAQKKKTYMDQFCKSQADYKKCEICKMIEKKYEEKR